MLKCKFKWTDEEHKSYCDCSFNIKLLTEYVDNSWKSYIEYNGLSTEYLDSSDDSVEAKQICELWFTEEILKSIERI